ncbi:MAG: endonuclease V [Fervidobacterium sp.]|uniref:endonuclease V n=1 Tax=Fervidobacterium sp. TaxID=1871331 RepID=UPI00404AA75E
MNRKVANIGRITNGHSEDFEFSYLIDVQNKLREKVELISLDFDRFETIAGVDVSYIDEEALGIVVLLDKELNLIQVVSEREKVNFPYVPGFLAFREAPVVLKCFEQLDKLPDLAVFDGQGIAHPRGFGIASHVGVLLDIPTIGVAKSKLYGYCEQPKQVGEAKELINENGERIGYCYMSKHRTKPIIISPGHKCDVDSALSIVKNLIKGYKLPEPVRLAHYYSQKLKPKT